MLSTALSQLLERARTRFGLEVEILDAELQHVYPETGSDLGRLIGESPAVRSALLDALAAGRPENLNRGGLSYRVFPLRRSARLRNGSGLMAIRGSVQAESPNMEPWSDLARAVVEADFAAADALSDERQNSRRLLATLRFLRHLVDTDTEADLSEAVVQAAAVWFDADARIYERDLAGDYVLHTALPGADVEEAGRRLNSLSLAGSNEVTRLRGVPEGWQPAAGSEVVLVPLSSAGATEWVLALIGGIPQDAEVVFPILGRVVGVQLEAMRARRRDRVRERVESLLVAGGRSVDTIAAQIVGELAETTGASSAALALNRQGRWRRLVNIGSIAPAPSTGAGAQSDWLFTSDQFVCEFQLNAGVRAVLELRPGSGKTFSPDAALVTRVTAGLLHVWLRGAEPALSVPAQAAPVARLPEPTVREMIPPAMSAFLGRIEEEMERARRFDLRLSLVLIDVPWQMPAEGEAVAQLQEALRRELRGSDVLGKMNGQRVAALLTHTDAPGSHKVVGRVRRRLAEAARQLNLGGITIGHAAFSPDCRTAEALVSQAMRDAEPVAV
jgi:GGDEF domain-containing protein